MNSVDNHFILHGPQFMENVPTCSYGRTIYKYLQKNVDLPIAMIDSITQKEVSYKTLIETTMRLAQSLQSYGITENDVIGISSENNTNFPVPLIASMWLSATVTLFNPLYKLREVLHVCNISKPKIIFCTQLSLPTILKAAEQLQFVKKIIVMDGYSDNGHIQTMESFISINLRKYKDSVLPVDADSEDVALIVYSSGTTGLPKGVMLTNKSLNISFLFLKDPRYFTQRPPGTTVALLIMPFFHIYGITVFMAGILLGRMCLIMSRFNGNAYLKAVQDYKVKSLLIAPPIANFLARSDLTLKYDLSHVENITSGAAPLSKHTEQLLLNRFKSVRHIRHGYGLTECPVAGVITRIDSPKPTSVGKLLPGTSAKIIDINTGKSLGPNQEGEICFKGAQIMKGYCGDIINTKKVIDKNGWLHTGDVGFYDEGEHFYVIDRIKELIKYKGFQVAPAELESVLLEHPQIADAAVIGVPDEDAGEVPLAFVVQRLGQFLTEGDVKKFVEERVTSSKYLRGGVKFVTEIPKNPSGKILRRHLREMILKQSKL